MESSGRYLVLAGDPAAEDHGVRAAVTVEVGDPGPDHPGPGHRRPRAGEAVLAAPLVRLIGPPGERRVLVGRVRVSVDADGACAVTLLVRVTWSERGGWHQEAEPRVAVDRALLRALAEPRHRIGGDPASVAVVTAKAFAEAARNEVDRLRDLRYEVERQVADLLAQRRSAALRPLLAQVVELSSALSRARDHARDTVRDGLSIHLWDPDTYHRNRGEATTAEPKPWAATHRNALRHCEAVDVLLSEEVDRLQTLLVGMSTFAVAQDGEAQQRFNTLAASAAAGLGVPALILALYGADDFLPFTADRAWRALAPIAVTALAAVTVALWRMPGRVSVRQYLAAVGLVVALVAILLVAGFLAPGG